MINVVKPFFPPIAEYQFQVQRIWKNEWLTNRGPLVQELEEKVMKSQAIDNILITNNGTLPIQIALKLLAKQGEVITTPFSYIATSSAIVWENCTPVFVDIDPEHLTIDETKIEAAITAKTTAILATHVFGNPCHIEAIEAIARRHKIAVIYDAAHCFGVKYNDKSLFAYGDISTCSFHATKVFHTGEGGAIFSASEALRSEIFFSHNFGHDGPTTFHGVGINGKISELQAAMGLSVLPYIDFIFSERKKVVEYYCQHLNFSAIQQIKLRANTEWNYSYFPLVFESESKLLQVMEAFKKNGIGARRYFCPSLNTLHFTNGKAMPISERIANTILCLPLYVGLKEEELKLICATLNAQF